MRGNHWETGKRSTIHRHFICFFFICTATTYYSTFIVAIFSQMLRCILYFAYCQYSEQLASHASEFVSIREYCSIL